MQGLPVELVEIDSKSVGEIVACFLVDDCVGIVKLTLVLAELFDVLRVESHVASLFAFRERSFGDALAISDKRLVEPNGGHVALDQQGSHGRYVDLNMLFLGQGVVNKAIRFWPFRRSS